MASDAEILSAEGLVVEYRSAGQSIRAVDGVDISIRESEFVALVGESGSGKSTLALALLNLARKRGHIVSGDIAFTGRSLRRISDGELNSLRGAGIGLIMQNARAALNPMLRVGIQIANVYRAHRGASKSEAKAKALQMLRLVGINDPERRYDAFPHQLSGGMAQRALIAQALVCEPRLLIADEPTSGLDVTVQAQILDDLTHSVQTTSSSVLLITQDLGIVANYANRVYVMCQGMMVEEAPVATFFGEPLHPASRALLSGQLGTSDAQESQRGSDGSASQGGCAVSSWCPWADTTLCVRQGPPLVRVDPTHQVRCHHVDRLKEGHVTQPLEDVRGPW